MMLKKAHRLQGEKPMPKVHAMLLDIVIAKQAAVVTTAELAGALPGRS
jgi:hypothetical protein